MLLHSFHRLFAGFQAYISCALRLEHVAPVMLCYGAVFGVGSVLVGVVLQQLKHYVVVAMATVFELGNLIVLFGWSPQPNDMALFYVVASCMGLCDAIWQTQVNGELHL